MPHEEGGGARDELCDARLKRLWWRQGLTLPCRRVSAQCGFGRFQVGAFLVVHARGARSRRARARQISAPSFPATKLKMLALTTFFSFAALLFGSFPRSLPPPLVLPTFTRLYTVTEDGLVGRVVPTTPPSYIACADHDGVHYFLLHGNCVDRAIWTRFLTDYEKSNVFQAMRKWRHACSNETLTSNFSDYDDMYCWELSHIEGDVEEDGSEDGSEDDPHRLS